MVVKCIRNRFQQKDYNETLQTILLLKALREEEFDHKLRQMTSFFSSNLDKFKVQIQAKTLKHFIDEKQVGIKGAIKVISSVIHIKSC